jgi:hypothetical protein
MRSAFTAQGFFVSSNSFIARARVRTLCYGGVWLNSQVKLIDLSLPATRPPSQRTYYGRSTVSQDGWQPFLRWIKLSSLTFIQIVCK